VTFRDPGVNPTYDAVGRAVVAASNLEFWFTELASGLAGVEHIEVARKERSAGA
jgi:hypothetical protein